MTYRDRFLRPATAPEGVLGRSREHGTWFWLDTALVDQYSAQIGAGGLALYAVLARYVNSTTSQCWPSIQTLQRHLGVSRNTVKKYLAQLAEAGLVHVQPHTFQHGSRSWQGYLFTLIRPRSPAQGSQERLRALPYADYLATAHWAAVRLEARRRAKQRCQLCNGPGPFHVHHRAYTHLGNELQHMEDVIVLCATCHAKHHDILPPPPAVTTAARTL